MTEVRLLFRRRRAALAVLALGAFVQTLIAGIPSQNIVRSDNIDSIGPDPYKAGETNIWRSTPQSYGYNDWGFLHVTSFTLGASEELNIIQPFSDSTLVIRVVGGAKSTLYGRIDSNGRVILINENGIELKPGSRMNVSSFMASTLNFSDSDLVNSRFGPIQSIARSGLSAVIADGEIEVFGGYYRNPTDSSQLLQIPGHVYLFGHRVRVGGDLVSFKEDSDLVILAGNQVRTWYGVDPAGAARVLAASNAHNAANPQSLAAVSGTISTYLPFARVRIAVDADDAVGAALDAVGVPALDFSADAMALDELTLDGGSWGRTLVDGAAIIMDSLSGAGSRIDVLGGRVEVFDSLLDVAFNTGSANQIRIGGDEAQVGDDRDGGAAGVRLAYATHVGADVQLNANPGDRVHLTGYSLLREGELGLLLLSGHDGPISPSWMKNREGVYDSDGDGDPDTCEGDEDMSFSLDNNIRETIQKIAARLENQTGKRPSTLEFNIHRTNVDVNREPGPATGLCMPDPTSVSEDDYEDAMFTYGDDDENNLAYDLFHELIGVAQSGIAARMVNGRGLMIDFHGHKDDITDGDSDKIGPVHIGHRMKGSEFRDVLLEATGKSLNNLFESDFENADFKYVLRHNAYSDGSDSDIDVEDLNEEASTFDLAEWLATGSMEQDSWRVIFGPDSLFKQMRARQEVGGQPYKLYVVQGVGVPNAHRDLKLRVGGYIQRRHGSSDDSPDSRAFVDGQAPSKSNDVHAGFVRTVDGIQLELPIQYRIKDSGSNQAMADDFAADLADSVLHMLTTLYSHVY